MLVLSLSIFAVSCWGMVQWLGGISSEGPALQAMLWGCLFGGLLGSGLWWFSRGADAHLGRREAMLLVAMSWLVGAALAALPFHVWAVAADQIGHPFHSFIDCYFEAMSGLTTTGATVLGYAGHTVNELPKVLLLWRALTQWLGGLGIVVLFVAVLPTLGVGGKKLFHIESPGPTSQGVRPRIGETARALWLIYVGMTIAEVVALWLVGMPLFNAVCHTFSTLATGGFSTQQASLGGDRFASQIIIIVFMVLAGVNFGLYYQLIQRRFKRVWTDTELRLYLGILVVASIVVVGAIFAQRIDTTAGQTLDSASFSEALRHGVFQVVSIGTGTGYCTADFDRWSFIAKTVLVVLMFVGPSAGSTGGGIKVIRIIVVCKVLVTEIERVFRPHVVRAVKVGKMTVSSDLKIATLGYVLSIVVLSLAGAVLLMLLETDSRCTFATAAMASVATLNNIGPGLAQVGAIENYGWLSVPSKVVLSVLMVMGRLELYAILVLVTPRFWKSE